mgnify:CR=1 FL=1
MKPTSSNIRKLGCYQSSRIDKISARLLKETAVEISPSLCKLFNKSLRTGAVPMEWWRLVPVYKGKAEQAENHCPISLLPIVSKVLERCVLNSLKDLWRKIVKSCQHGFLNGKSCTSNLLKVLDYIGLLLDNEKQVDIVYMDISKPLDKVCHYRLLQKLRHFGFRGSMLQMILSNRSLPALDHALRNSGSTLSDIRSVLRLYSRPCPVSFIPKQSPRFCCSKPHCNVC